jgi:hypothetical protein
MGLRASLAPPEAPRPAWRWHDPRWMSLPVSAFTRGDRRMEAENYLTSGFGVRVAIEARKAGLTCLGEVARVWQPSRLKGIQVSREFGTPFLAATQLFDLRPVPRKWLSIDRTHESADRFVTRGSILVTCSGNVGRATLARQVHEGVLVSHDLLRIEASAPEWWGWIYAYLRAAQVREMLKTVQYGHIIKHLETTHLNVLPIPKLRDDLLADFGAKALQITRLRDQAEERVTVAENHFEGCIGRVDAKDLGEGGFSVKASSIFEGRRRIDASVHNPAVTKVRRHLKRNGQGVTRLGDLGFDCWLPTRFKRVPAEDGAELMDSSDLFEINPDGGRVIADGDFGDPHRGRVEPGWLLVARSGQAYGLNGSITVATAAHQGKVISDDIIRVAPRTSAAIPVGYLFVALSHPTLGRPLVKSIIYGSSIPHLEVTDLQDLPVVRLAVADETRIADLADQASASWAEADLLEQGIAREASDLIDRFIAGQKAFLAED